MSNFTKVILGFMSILPISSLIILFIKFFYVGEFFNSSGGLSPSTITYTKFLSINLIILMIMIIYYVFHVMRDKQMTKDKKWLWTVLLICLNINILPFYWYLRVWKDHRAKGDIHDK